MQEISNAKPAWQFMAVHLLGMALIALLNPHTLFVRDATIYWLAAFAAPVLLGAGYAGIRACFSPGKGGSGGGAGCFIGTSWQLLSVVLLFQWADV
jgi:hypothetical protein